MKTTTISKAGILVLVTIAVVCALAQQLPRLEFKVLSPQESELSWTNAGFVLQSARAVSGPYTNLVGAPSPHVFCPTNPAEFFRLVQTVDSPFALRYAAPTFNTAIGDPFGCGCTSPENPNSLAAGGSAQDNAGGTVLLHTGELTQHAVDLEIPGRGFNWRFERRYRSGIIYDGPLGQGCGNSVGMAIAARWLEIGRAHV